MFKTIRKIKKRIKLAIAICVMLWLMFAFALGTAVTVFGGMALSRYVKKKGFCGKKPV